MFKVKRRASELMQTPLALETDSEASAQMLSTTPFASLPAKDQRWRAVLQNFESITIKYVGFKGVAMADQLSRQAKWYKASSSLLLQVATVAMGYTRQDVEEAAAGLLGDDTRGHTLWVFPVPGDVTQPPELVDLLDAQAACPQAREARKSAVPRPEQLAPGKTAFYIGNDEDDLPGALYRAMQDGTTRLTQLYLPSSMREEAIKKVHDQAHVGAKGTYKALRRTWYFPDMQAAVEDYVRGCLPCAQSKTTVRTVKPGHFRSRETSRLFETMSVDVLELSVPSRDYRHVLVLQDMYSTLILLIPLKTQTATEITEALIERCVGLFGSPEELVSDKG
jgi:hypothetical protein